MSLHHIHVFFLFHFSLSTIIEIECYRKNTVCVEEVFKKGDPVSILAKVTSSDVKEPNSIFLILKNDSLRVLKQTKIEKRHEEIPILLNSISNQNLLICIDNQEEKNVFIELDIKTIDILVKNELAFPENEYKSIDNGLSELSVIMEKSYSYFEQVDQSIRDLEDKNSTFEKFIWIYGLSTMIFVAVFGTVYSIFLKKKVSARKIF